MTIIHPLEAVMDLERSKAVVGRYYDEVLNGGDLTVVDELAVADYVENDPFPGQGNGRQDLRARVATLLAAFSPREFVIEDVVAERDRVVVRWRCKGTHSGDFLGIPATHREFDIAGIDIHRLESGRMAEHWHVVDQLAQLQQLGVIPAPAEA